MMFPRCPECHAYTVEQPVHTATNLKITGSYTKYVEEPVEFIDSVTGIRHEHDNNIIVVSWICGAGHEFSTEKTKMCSGCVLESADANKRAMEMANSGSSMQRFNTFSGGHGGWINTSNGGNQLA